MNTTEASCEMTERTSAQSYSSDIYRASLGCATLSEIKGLSSSAATFIANDGFAIADSSVGSPDTRTRQERVQEFVDNFGKLGKLYAEAVDDPARFAAFQKRMEDVQTFDRQTFKDLGSIGERLAANPPMRPEEVGKELANILKTTMDRKGGNIDLASEEWKNLQAAMAGIMIAAGATFEQATKDKQNITMVDAMDEQLRANGIPFVYAIIWGDTKEPGLAIDPSEKPLTPEQRHDYL